MQGDVPPHNSYMLLLFYISFCLFWELTSFHWWLTFALWSTKIPRCFWLHLDLWVSFLLSGMCMVWFSSRWQIMFKFPSLIVKPRCVCAHTHTHTGPDSVWMGLLSLMGDQSRAVTWECIDMCSLPCCQHVAGHTVPVQANGPCATKPQSSALALDITSEKDLRYVWRITPVRA